MYKRERWMPLMMYMERQMSLTHIDIDDEALETAKRLGRHRTKTAAVAEALRVYNERLTRAAAFDRYFELAQGWDLERSEAAHRAEKKQLRG
jgi:Arc/MetJ family transcription regulator